MGKPRRKGPGDWEWEHTGGLEGKPEKHCVVERDTRLPDFTEEGLAQSVNAAASFLSTVWYLRDLGEEDLHSLAKQSRDWNLKAGSPIMTSGEHSQCMYIVRSGSCVARMPAKERTAQATTTQLHGVDIPRCHSCEGVAVCEICPVCDGPKLLRDARKREKEEARATAAAARNAKKGGASVSLLAGAKANESGEFKFPGGLQKTHKRAPTPGNSMPCAMCGGGGFLPCGMCQKFTCHVFDKNKKQATIPVAGLSQSDWFGNVTFMLPEFGTEPFSVVARTDVSLLVLPRAAALGAMRSLGTEGMVRTKTQERLEDYHDMAYERGLAAWEDGDALQSLAPQEPPPKLKGLMADAALASQVALNVAPSHFEIGEVAREFNAFNNKWISGTAKSSNQNGRRRKRGGKKLDLVDQLLLERAQAKAKEEQEAQARLIPDSLNGPRKQSDSRRDGADSSANNKSSPSTAGGEGGQLDSKFSMDVFDSDGGGFSSSDGLFLTANPLEEAVLYVQRSWRSRGFRKAWSTFDMRHLKMLLMAREMKVDNAKIDLDDLDVLFAELGLEKTADELVAMITILDTDGSGSIELTEFCAIMKVDLSRCDPEEFQDMAELFSSVCEAAEEKAARLVDAERCRLEFEEERKTSRSRGGAAVAVPSPMTGRSREHTAAVQLGVRRSRIRKHEPKRVEELQRPGAYKDGPRIYEDRLPLYDTKKVTLQLSSSNSAPTLRRVSTAEVRHYGMMEHLQKASHARAQRQLQRMQRQGDECAGMQWQGDEYGDEDEGGKAFSGYNSEEVDDGEADDVDTGPAVETPLEDFQRAMAQPVQREPLLIPMAVHSSPSPRPLSQEQDTALEPWTTGGPPDLATPAEAPFHVEKINRPRAGVSNPAFRAQGVSDRRTVDEDSEAPLIVGYRSIQSRVMQPGAGTKQRDPEHVFDHADLVHASHQPQASLSPKHLPQLAMSPSSGAVPVRTPRAASPAASQWLSKQKQPQAVIHRSRSDNTLPLMGSPKGQQQSKQAAVPKHHSKEEFALALKKDAARIGGANHFKQAKKKLPLALRARRKHTDDIAGFGAVGKGSGEANSMRQHKERAALDQVSHKLMSPKVSLH